jgi:hypothetical protein
VAVSVRQAEWAEDLELSTVAGPSTKKLLAIILHYPAPMLYVIHPSPIAGRTPSAGERFQTAPVRYAIHPWVSTATQG